MNRVQAARNGRHAIAALAVAALLAACGGGGSPSAVDASAADAGAARSEALAAAAAPAPSRLDAVRFLNQATFGATEADIARVMQLGYARWLDAQFALPASPDFHWKRYQADAEAATPKRAITGSFFTQAVTAPDQLRQRVAYALSQIMVVSTQDLTGDRASAVASYADMLARNAFGRYRRLLQDVTLHPAMGLYLSHMGNARENPARGRIPDQNYAREVMQLFSIGLVRLEPDGRPALDAEGKPVRTYGESDIVGLSRVFTGFGWAGPDTTDARFWGQRTARHPLRMKLPMQAYPKWHSLGEKAFLGRTIAASAVPDPEGDLKLALDTIAGHPNVGPFIGRQLIQRLVTANPSPAYVGRVSRVFADNGAGVRGDLKAVVRAVLLDPEARAALPAQREGHGKLREPVLRLTALLRAFHARSADGRFLIPSPDEGDPSLTQGPLHAPSVFNFYRPGYIAPGTETGALRMTEPELQITDEATTLAYVNYMVDVVARGAGQRAPGAARRDVQLVLDAALSRAADAGALADLVATRLRGEAPRDGLRREIVAAVESIPLPAANGRNAQAIEKARLARVQTALVLMLAAPEFIVQR